ncbi:MAG: PEP-CTERM sorting domain-containing protein [Verrucomicrobiales bacterium]|jgi:hypothetical protein|nr:PEP-CTERM sorting domain-containing protein [Verrucomicrobiales bacterium]
MNTHTLFRKLAGILGVTFALGLSGQAQNLFINFDATTATAPDNAPYVAPGGNTGLWTTLSPTSATADSHVGSITISYGVKSSWNSIDFGTITGSSVLRPLALGNVYNSGIYATGGVGRGGLLEDSSYSASNDVALGMQITGLAVGEYKIYLSGINTSSTSTLSSLTNNFFLSTSVTKDANGVVFAADSQLNPTSDFIRGVQNNTTANTTSWVVGQNYVELSFTISSADDVLTLISKSTGDDKRGIFNSMQIVQIPEPSTWALIGIGLGFIGILRLRKSRA